MAAIDFRMDLFWRVTNPAPVASNQLLVFLFSSIDQEAHSFAQYGPVLVSLINCIF